MEYTEKYLIEGCKKKDPKVQQQLYDTYKVSMFRLCLRYAKNRQEAEDMLQDGFIRVFRDLHQFRGQGVLGGWIRRVMVNVALQHIRKQKKLFETVEIEQAADLKETDELIFSEMRMKALTRIIQQLPTGYRTVFNLFVLEGYSHKEIAECLGISINTSKSQLFKAKAMLRKVLESSMMG